MPKNSIENWWIHCHYLCKHKYLAWVIADAKSLQGSVGNPEYICRVSSFYSQSKIWNDVTLKYDLHIPQHVNILFPQWISFSCFTLQFIRFLRRTEGVEAARKYFLDSRKSPNCTYHVYVAYAMMAFCLDKDPKVVIFSFSYLIFMYSLSLYL
jgi:hypothetical protein